MAKKSKIVREKKLLKNVQKYAQKRAELKSKFFNDFARSFVLWLLISSESNNIISSLLILFDKAHFIAKIFSFLFREKEWSLFWGPIDTAPPLKLGGLELPRLSFREMALNGEIPGITKARW